MRLAIVIAGAVLALPAQAAERNPMVPSLGLDTMVSGVLVGMTEALQQRDTTAAGSRKKG